MRKSENPLFGSRVQKIVNNSTTVLATGNPIFDSESRENFLIIKFQGFFDIFTPSPQNPLLEVGCRKSLITRQPFQLREIRFLIHHPFLIYTIISPFAWYDKFDITCGKIFLNYDVTWDTRAPQLLNVKFVVRNKGIQPLKCQRFLVVAFFTALCRQEVMKICYKGRTSTHTMQVTRCVEKTELNVQ